MRSYLSPKVCEIERQIVNHIEYTIAKTRFDFNNTHAFQATALSVRDRLIEQLNDSIEFFHSQKSKTLNFMSGEFMFGRQLQRHLVNINLEQNYA
jgi:starch phosphorylase